MSTPTWLVSPAAPDDLSAWQSLFRAYAASAGQQLDDAHLARVWSWIHDPGAQTRCLLLRTATDGPPVGLAHHRLFERPLDGSVGCWLDDLWVDPAHRGRGAARTLLRHLAALADEHGCTTVRWTTAETNPAQRLYDSLATRIPVLTYDLAPTPPA